MVELDQLKRHVETLSREDLAEFRAWFLAWDDEQWDKQIEADLAAGKLDHLIAEARAAINARKAKRA